MKNTTKLKLSQLGFSTIEINALEQLPDAINSLNIEKSETNFIKDEDGRNKKINEEICKEYSISEQIAILRKAIASLNCTNEEFTKFNNRVEDIIKK